jgi:hypothetical protein
MKRKPIAPPGAKKPARVPHPAEDPGPSPRPPAKPSPPPRPPEPVVPEVKVGDPYVNEFGMPVRVIGHQKSFPEIIWFRVEWPHGRCYEFGTLARTVREDIAAGRLKRRT